MDRVKYMRGEEIGVSAEQQQRKGARSSDVLRSAVEMMDELRGHVPPKHGDTWGKWKLNGYGGPWTLDYARRDGVNFNAITTNAAMNDWTFQLAQKTWGTAEDLRNLSLTFQDIFVPRAH